MKVIRSYFTLTLCALVCHAISAQETYKQKVARQMKQQFDEHYQVHNKIGTYIQQKKFDQAQQLLKSKQAIDLLSLDSRRMYQKQIDHGIAEQRSAEQVAKNIEQAITKNNLQQAASLIETKGWQLAASRRKQLETKLDVAQKKFATDVYERITQSAQHPDTVHKLIDEHKDLLQRFYNKDHIDDLYRKASELKAQGLVESIKNYLAMGKPDRAEKLLKNTKERAYIALFYPNGLTVVQQLDRKVKFAKMSDQERRKKAGKNISPLANLSEQDLKNMGFEEPVDDIWHPAYVKDYKKLAYTVLGVTADASDSEIKKAYHTRSLKWHPDRPSGNTAYMQLLNWANDYLTKPQQELSVLKEISDDDFKAMGLTNPKQLKELDVKGQHTDLAYAILGVSSDASNEELKKAYKIRAIKWHPDKGGKDKYFDLLGWAKRQLSF